MKILWIVNTIFPDVCIAKGLPVTAIGGWMYSSAKALSQREGVELTVVATHQSAETEFHEIDNIKYYLIPSDNNITYNSSLEKYWKNIFEIESPEVVHIHGTEFSHGLAAMAVFDTEKFLISMQGLVSVYTRYFLAGLVKRDIKNNITLRDLIKGNLYKDQRKFRSKGDLEREYILKTAHVMGRTSWDYAHVKSLNPDVQYHFCNEMLRSNFYTAAKWDYNTKKKYHIFLSQAGYPIKGLHKVLEAMALLKQEFPQMELRIGGIDIVKTGVSLVEKLRISGYGKYIQKLILRTGLEKNINFLGMMTEDQMITEYQNAHIFICPSSIENSPNSLGEAQIIGTPVIASYVGGIPDMVNHNSSGLLYRFSEIEMLAMYIGEIFRSEEKALYLSKNGIAAAEDRHHVGKIINSMLESYHFISSKI